MTAGTDAEEQPEVGLPRGVARVGRPAGVRGIAAVPGALSWPRPAPGGPASAESAPDQSPDQAPDQSPGQAPDQSSGRSASDQPTPVKVASMQPAPDQSASGQPPTAQPLPGPPSVAQPVPSRPVPAQSLPARPVPAQPLPARPVPARPLPARPLPAQLLAARPLAARPLTALPGSGVEASPRPAPRRWPQLASPAMAFPRRFHPVAEPPDEPPSLRQAAPEIGPARREQMDRRTVDGQRAVRKKSLLRRAALPAVTALVAAFAVATGYLTVTDRAPRTDIGRWTGLPATASGNAAPANGASANAAPANGASANGAPVGGAPDDRPAGDPFGSVAAAPSGVPTRLRVAAIGLDTTLEQLHLGPDGTLLPPKTFGQAGWYADGTAPGDNGPAVLAGHVDSKAGPAVFYRLRELTSGDRIEVERGGAVLRFTVTRTAWYPKIKFPTTQVYGPTPDRQLRLITCGGVFDRSLRSYKDNLVVYAVAG